MTERERRVIEAFLKTVRDRNETKEYVIILMEDEQRFGWLSDTAKQYFYDHVDDQDEWLVED